MCEQRTPFAGGGLIVRRAADEFVASVGGFHKLGGAECCEGFASCPTKPEGIFYFHADSMTPRVGHRLSMLKIILESVETSNFIYSILETT